MKLFYVKIQTVDDQENGLHHNLMIHTRHYNKYTRNQKQEFVTSYKVLFMSIFDKYEILAISIHGRTTVY